MATIEIIAITITIAIFAIPTLFWGIAPFVATILDYEGMENTLQYPLYWEDIVRHKGFTHTGHGVWGGLWRFWLDNKAVRIMNIISLMFIWGYILLLVGYAIGWLIRLVFVKGLYGALKGIGRGIANLYRAI